MMGQEPKRRPHRWDRDSARPAGRAGGLKSQAKARARRKQARLQEEVARVQTGLSVLRGRRRG